MVLGIDLGGTNIRVGQIENSTIIRKASYPSPAQMVLEQSIEYLKNSISQLFNVSVKGIGIGVPSVLDIEKGIVYNVANIPAWKEVRLKEILESEFNVPVFINNDSNCFTLGETRFGQGKPYRNMVGITLGTGVGSGIIINNQLYNGVNTGAGEIGCIPYLDATYEHYCSSEFFSVHYQTTGKEAAEKAKKNDLKAVEIWNEFGRHIGELIHVVLFTYDPEAIIFGGGIAEAFPLFSKTMWETIRSFPYPKSLEKLQIRISDNPDIALLGASALVD